MTTMRKVALLLTLTVLLTKVSMSDENGLFLGKAAKPASTIGYAADNAAAKLAAEPLSPTAVFGKNYYVSADEGNDEHDGLSWQTAKATIQAAVDLAEDEEHILVAPGVYDRGGKVTPGFNLTNRVCATRAVVIRAVNDDPTLTVIVGAADEELQGHGTNAIRCVYLEGGASLHGFTLTGGYTLPDETGAAIQDTYGGGVFLNEGSLVSNCLIVTNSSGRYGGGAVCFEGGEITHTTIGHNSSYSSGGGIYCYYGGTIRNCTIHDNTALGPSGTAGGGGICSMANPTRAGLRGADIFDCHIFNNHSTAGGGGIYYSRGDSKVYNCIIVSNTAYAYSGGVFGNISGVISNCLISGNTGTSSASGNGGVYLYSSALLTHSTVIYNTGAGGAGGVNTRSASINNCLIANNTGKDRGGVNAYDNAKIRNCTIAWNNCSQTPLAGGVVFGAGSANTLQSCIVWGNEGPALYNGATEPLVSYTCVDPAPEGEGNFSADPLFANPAAGNFRLGSGSPCINAGLLEPWMAGGVDLDGNPRIRLNKVDVGCYEHYPVSTVIMLR